jgi:hypothetical protein
MMMNPSQVIENSKQAIINLKNKLIGRTAFYINGFQVIPVVILHVHPNTNQCDVARITSPKTQYTNNVDMIKISWTKTEAISIIADRHWQAMVKTIETINETIMKQPINKEQE